MKWKWRLMRNVVEQRVEYQEGLEPAGARSGSGWFSLLFGRLPPS